MIILFLYADDVLLFANTLGDAQNLMKAIKNFCMHTKLSVNSSKTKIMLVKSQRKDESCIMYNSEALDCMESFKYFFSSNHRWSECATRRSEAEKRDSQTCLGKSVHSRPLSSLVYQRPVSHRNACELSHVQEMVRMADNGMCCNMY